MTALVLSGHEFIYTLRVIFNGLKHM